MKRKLACVLLAAVIMLCGCNIPILKGNYAETLYIKIINATDCSNEVYYKTIDLVVGGDGRYENSPRITKEQLTDIRSYVNKISVPDYVENKRDLTLQPDEYEGHTFLGEIYISHHSLKTPDSELHREFWCKREIFDSYPEGYEDFINMLNEIAGGDPVMLGEPLEISADTFEKVTGIGDEMITDGTVEDILTVCPFDTYQLMDSYFNKHPFRYMDCVKIDDLCANWPLYRALPWEIRNEQSTEQEFRTYAEEVAAALGLDPSSVIDSESGGKVIEGQGITIYQTSDIPSDLEYTDTIPYHLIHHVYYDSNQLDGGYRKTIFYSPDGKFAIALNGCLESSYSGNTLTADEVYEIYLSIADLVERV